MFLAMGTSTIFAQQEVADTVSIDDMAPILYDEEPEAESQSSNTGLYIGIVIVAVVAGVLVYKVVTKKK
jgi:hypothetical protein